MQHLAEFKPWFIEEPTSPDDILGHKAIRTALAPLGIGVATGEMCQNRVMFKQFLASGAIDVCQIDACRMGGVNEVLAVLLMAKKYAFFPDPLLPLQPITIFFFFSCPIPSPQSPLTTPIVADSTSPSSPTAAASASRNTPNTSARSTTSVSAAGVPCSNTSTTCTSTSCTRPSSKTAIIRRRWSPGIVLR